jgi:hypothetical protein
MEFDQTVDDMITKTCLNNGSQTTNDTIVGNEPNPKIV